MIGQAITNLQQALDPLSGCHDDGGEDAGDAAGHGQLRQRQLLVGVFLLQLLPHAEAHEAQREDGRHAH